MKQKLQCWTLILIYVAIWWFGSIATVEANNQLPTSRTKQILERLSFGTTSEQLQAVEQQGIETYIQGQLEPETVPESPILEQYLKPLEAEYQEPASAISEYRSLSERVGKNSDLPQKAAEKILQERSLMRRESRDIAVQMHLAKAIFSSRQLQEVMVDFWFNHFNVFAQKYLVYFWVKDYEDRIRENALGNFRDLLEVTASHPAMLLYLDNRFNTDPNSRQARGSYSGLNENYARELMELHTLGVDGGYTQEDVVNLARIFTGWSIRLKPQDKIGFFFNQVRHDPGEKVFLGQKITTKGIEEGRQALDILATHPSTAHFISYKLAQYFVADDPPERLVDSLAQEFLATNGNIKAVMDTLIHSPEFFASEPENKKFTTPYQYLISLVRLAEIKNPGLLRIQGMLNQLSMPIYLCLPPTGYKNTQAAWLNPQAMLQRITFASAIVNQRLDPDSPIKYETLADNFGELSPRTKQAIAQSPELRSELILSSPEAMYR